MPKAPIKTDKQGNKPKLSTKEKQQKKKDGARHEIRTTERPPRHN